MNLRRTQEIRRNRRKRGTAWYRKTHYRFYIGNLSEEAYLKLKKLARAQGVLCKADDANRQLYLNRTLDISGVTVTGTLVGTSA